MMLCFGKEVEIMEIGMLLLCRSDNRVDGGRSLRFQRCSFLLIQTCFDFVATTRKEKGFDEPRPETTRAIHDLMWNLRLIIIFFRFNRFFAYFCKGRTPRLCQLNSIRTLRPHIFVTSSPKVYALSERCLCRGRYCRDVLAASFPHHLREKVREK